MTDATIIGVGGVSGDATHAWAERFAMDVCADCGVVRRRDRLNSPCRGKVKVALRGDGGEK